LTTPLPALEQVRLDVWLDVACVFRTRSEAQRACKGGKVTINGQRAKPHRDIRVADQITITRGNGHHQQLVVTGLAERHRPKAEARQLYEDVTPAPSSEELEFRALLRRAGEAGAGRDVSRPDKRGRRKLRELKGR
jgi:ribosome-associated heat shock protein Hsp15